MKKDSKIYVAGHGGMVGSAIKRRLEAEGYANIIYRNHRELDLISQSAVEDFFAQEKPEYVFLAAAKVGGIKANDMYSADFIYENLMIEANIVHCACVHGVKKLLFLGSSCIYPKQAPQPLKEEYLLTGLLEQTNEAYALAKIAGIQLCRMYRKQYGCDFIAAMPTNLYGPHDNYHPENSHVIPGLIRRFHEAKVSGQHEVVCWGTGAPLREFLYADDLSEACLFLMKHYSGSGHINIGTGKETTIRELAGHIARTVGFTGTIHWDASMPDGTPRKLLDASKIRSLGWHHTTELEEGLQLAYEDFIKSKQGVNALRADNEIQLSKNMQPEG
ncbi:MAG: GDP-L-fucose synthase [Pseudomonadota bacterium]